ncbi:PLP-dependent aminotransferase family protein [Xylanibacillus composti]|uniref:GntR family transcriptional regulator n=1 Tax=Xylanibacillus composti TaxID=1572762 RepID=A0A8J4M2L5_9BACL|nr:PLP-dependent aminotransferase family protein [Xylanibacillus composti]MDT9724853.1 PLP-dependent aminotransferase family protein [Xylanibacillus composti]GIQ69052.1 GntR family transcriptional regulator [Xylanibacillus composti]
MFGIYLDPASRTPVTSQLCNQLRQKIEYGELAEGTRLPPTRRLAQEFGIARNIAIDAYEQLIAEGYLIGQPGSGTYVAEGIRLTATSRSNAEMPVMIPGIDDQPKAKDLIDFTVGTPDLQSFPRKIWAKYLKTAAETAPGELYDYGDIRGVQELRVEIAAYLHRTRGMRCHSGQIMIVSGSSEGMALIAQAMRPSFASVYLEDPTIEFAQHIFFHAHYGITPMEVDASGMRLHEISRFQNGHLMLLTPSHQFPTGSILSIRRRQHAVRLAEQADAYIIEDDYDGDFRLKGVPIPSLHTLNPDRVIYVGTFSKTLAPGMRIGFLVVPPALLGRFAELKENLNLRAQAVPQAALAQFMKDGRLDRHIHKMKGIYRARRNVLVNALKQKFGDWFRIRGDEAGMHVLLEVTGEPWIDSWQHSAAFGVRVHEVEDYCLLKGKRTHQIVLGYGNVQKEDIETGIERLHQFVQHEAAYLP